MLDEPTGHLDVEHIAWLVGYVKQLQEDRERMVTVLLVSHDKAFLDEVCSHIIYAWGLGGPRAGPRALGVGGGYGAFWR